MLKGTYKRRWPINLSHDLIICVILIDHGHDSFGPFTDRASLNGLSRASDSEMDWLLQSRACAGGPIKMTVVWLSNLPPILRHDSTAGSLEGVRTGRSKSWPRLVYSVFRWTALNTGADRCIATRTLSYCRERKNPAWRKFKFLLFVVSTFEESLSARF